MVDANGKEINVGDTVRRSGRMCAGHSWGCLNGIGSCIYARDPCPFLDANGISKIVSLCGDSDNWVYVESGSAYGRCCFERNEIVRVERDWVEI
jgi:hypothetical protein